MNNYIEEAVAELRKAQRANERASKPARMGRNTEIEILDGDGEHHQAPGARPPLPEGDRLGMFSVFGKAALVVIPGMFLAAYCSGIAAVQVAIFVVYNIVVYLFLRGRDA